MKANILWGILLGALFTSIVQLSIWLTSDPSPYKDVVVDSVERTEEGYIVSAHFTKLQCEFKRLEIFGSNTGRPVYLQWEPLDGSPATDYDRSVGNQQLIILAISGGMSFDTIEIRTRHDCDGELVDSVFATIDTQAL